jgi:hypothetical protein
VSGVAKRDICWRTLQIAGEDRAQHTTGNGKPSLVTLEEEARGSRLFIRVECLGKGRYQ